MKKTLVAAALASCIGTAQATEWQTISTENFNVHYQAESKAWALSAANELEIVRDKVNQQQGRVLNKKVDVLVFDPTNVANGFALPFSKEPQMALITTPPQSDTAISNHSGWQQLLVLHEYVHLVHLAQPTRNEWRQKLREIYGLYDITYDDMPRWVAEGYATLLESQMTGRGRLHDNYVEALIQQFAREGALPTYGQLNSTDGDFMIGAMAYLVGVRYLQWLETHYGKDTLDAVWTRMQAVEKRDFNQAFKGVFGDSASKLYKRFVAEYTYQAMATEATQNELDSKLWLDLSHNQNTPVISPDESKLAVVSRDKKGDIKLTVYATSENEKAKEAFANEQKELLEADSKDIAAKAPSVFAREQKRKLHAIDKKGIVNPVWADNNTLIFGAFSIANNELATRHQDLFKWNTETGEVEQLTEFANIRRFSLAENNIAYAERAKNGYSELVKVDLSTGEVSELTTNNLATLYDFPKVHGNKLAYLKSSLNENWALYVNDLTSNNTLQVPAPKGYQFLSYPEWEHDGSAIYYVAGVNGALNLYKYQFASDTLTQLTHGQQVVSYPVPTQQHGLLYMATNAEGPDVYQLGENAHQTVVTERAQTLLADTSKAEQFILPPAKIYSDEVGVQSDYSISDQKASFTYGAHYASAATSMIELGVKGNDFLHRVKWQVGASIDSKDALSGFYGDIKYQAGNWNTLLHAFDYELNSAAQYQGQDAIASEFSATGVYGEFNYPYRNDQFTLNTQVAVNYTDYAHDHTKWLRLGVTQDYRKDYQWWSLGQTVSANIYSGDSAAGSWQGHDAAAAIYGSLWKHTMYLSYSERVRDDARLALGGFSASVLKGAAQADYVFAQELPFLTASTDDYANYQAGISFSGFAPYFYYQQHHLDGEEFATSYGIKISGAESFGIGSAAINDIRFNFGVARVEGDTIEDELRAWLGLNYSL